MSSSGKLILAGALSVALPWSALAQSALQAPSGDSGWWALESGGETCVSDRAGERQSCWPRAGELSDLRETAHGWIAAGHLVDGGIEDLFLMRDRGKGPEVLAAPEPVGEPRGRPMLISDDTRLLGLVWLEGSTQEVLQVRAAEWTGDRWGQTVTVSPTGPGSQVAPRVTVLADGRWLLVWTAYDGHDDETVWSLHDRGGWSVPAPLHDDNDSPDILPTLVTTRRGAIAAWSWLDGRDYRLRTAFFDGTGWRVDAPSGGRGSLEALFFETSGSYLLSFMTVVPDEWAVWEFDDAGRVLERTATVREDAARPMVDYLGSGVAFRWSVGEVISAAWESKR